VLRAYANRCHIQEKKKWQPPKATRVGKKKKKKGPQVAYKLPLVMPNSKCKLRMLRMERLKDFLLIEEEFLMNQEAVRPREAKEEEEKNRVEELRGTPMNVGTLEEIIDGTSLF
jgi:26S proteasome regulatory subunit T2